MMLNYAGQRILRSTPGVLSWQPLDGDGVEASVGTVTVGVTRSDGSVVIAPGTATNGTGSEPRTYVLTPTQTADLDYLTATWSISGVEYAQTLHEVVGGVYVSVGEIRSTEKSLAHVVQYPNADLVAATREIERLFESVTGVAWVPRFEVERIDGSGRRELVLMWPRLRRVRWCKIWSANGNVTDLTPEQVEAIVANRSGIAVRADAWPVGIRNIEIAYEHGNDSPPADLRKAAVHAIRKQANQFKSAVPDRATTYTMIEGGTVTLATPGVGNWHTGIPEVDEVLKRYVSFTPSIA
jgi:hypothetical protein